MKLRSAATPRMTVLLVPLVLLASASAQPTWETMGIGERQTVRGGTCFVDGRTPCGWPYGCPLECEGTKCPADGKYKFVEDYANCKIQTPGQASCVEMEPIACYRKWTCKRLLGPDYCNCKKDQAMQVWDGWITEKTASGGTCPNST